MTGPWLWDDGAVASGCDGACFGGAAWAGRAPDGLWRTAGVSWRPAERTPSGEGEFRRCRRGLASCGSPRKSGKAVASPARPGLWAYDVQGGVHPLPHREDVGGRQPGIHPHCHLSQPPKGWRPSPLGSALSCLPRVASGLTGEPAPPDTLSAWTETTPRPPAIPPRTVRLDSARVRGDEERIGEGVGAGISLLGGR